jgi:hypothetical protein
VLFVLIPAAWLAVLFFALTLCRLAALSDASCAAALAERIATGDPAEQEAVPADAASELPYDPQPGVHRATG